MSQLVGSPLIPDRAVGDQGAGFNPERVLGQLSSLPALADGRGTFPILGLADDLLSLLRVPASHRGARELIHRRHPGVELLQR